MACCAPAKGDEEPSALEKLNAAEMEKEAERAEELKRVMAVWEKQVKSDLRREQKRLEKKAREWKIAEQARVDRELYEYARIGLLPKVEVLVCDCGAVNGAYRSGDNDTAWTIAEKMGHAHVVQWFEAGGNTNRANLAEQTELDQALFQACRDSDIRLARSLLEKGARPDGHKNFWGVTALHKAVVRKREGGLPMMQLLLEAGASVNRCDGKTGMSPLHKAAARNSVEKCHWLVLHGALIDAQDHVQRTPLHHATDFGHTRTMKLLVNHGASIKIQDNAGRTPADLARARSHRDIVQFLEGVPWNIAETRADRKLIFKAAMEKANKALGEQKEARRAKAREARARSPSPETVSKSSRRRRRRSKKK